MFYEHDIKIDSFIQIPKILFRNEKYSKLPLICKIAYSIYLTRYSITKYKDSTGPYIIYSDKEIAKFLDTTPQYIKTIRRKLKDADLIDYKRSVGNNKIYLYSYTDNSKGDKTFFYENTLDSWQFYRFPTELFDEKFINLPLNAKFIYVMYLDMMFLSLNYNYKDNKDRIYFSEELENQQDKANMTIKTIRKYRNYLKACRLLSEYRPFGKPIRFYLLRLDMYEDNVFKYENMTAHEQKDFIKNISNEFAKKFIEEPKNDSQHDVAAIKNNLKKNKITYSEAIEYYIKDTGNSLSVPGLRKYLNGSRKMPDIVYGWFSSIDWSDPSKRKISTKEKENNITIKKEINRQAKTNKTYEFYSYNDTNTNNNDIKEQIKNNDNNITYSINEKQKDKLQIKLNDIENQVKKSFFNITPADKNFLLCCINTMKNKTQFQIKKDNKKLSRSDLYSLFQYVDDYENFFISILNSMNGYYFKTPENQINFFMTSMINKLNSIKLGYSWFKQSSSELQIYIDRNYSRPDNVSDEIKNYKWYE